MTELEFHIVQLIFCIGVTIVLALLIKAGLKHTSVPPLIGYMALGFLLRVVDTWTGFLSQQTWWVYLFLADLGIIVLLFRVGLESKLAKLLAQLRRASVVWIGDICISGVLGYLVSRYLLGFALISSCFVAVALTATSVGVSVGIWQGAKALNSANGSLLLDVAELDDISGLILMASLFAVAPILRGDLPTALLPIMTRTVGLLLLTMVAFGAFCFFFSNYAEQSLTNFFLKVESPPNPMLMVTGISFIIAALAGLLGFSVAIGAFFSGLVFSRDPQVVKIDASFDAIHELFSPFFFIGIGLHIDPSVLASAFGLGLILLLAAILGKMLGAGGATFIISGWTSAALLSISMVPRAEIAMIIMQQGLQLGEWAVPTPVFGAMVMVSAVTCFAAPLVLPPLLQRWPQIQREPT